MHAACQSAEMNRVPLDFRSKRQRLTEKKILHAENRTKRRLTKLRGQISGPNPAARPNQ